MDHNHTNPEKLADTALSQSPSILKFKAVVSSSEYKKQYRSCSNSNIAVKSKSVDSENSLTANRNDSPMFIFSCLVFLIQNKTLAITYDGVAVIISLYFLLFYLREVNWITFPSRWIHSPVWLHSSLLLNALWAIMLSCVLLLSAHVVKYFLCTNKNDCPQRKGFTLIHFTDKAREGLRWLFIFRSIISIVAVTTLMCSINTSNTVLEKSSMMLIGINFLTFIISIFLRCYIQKNSYLLKDKEENSEFCHSGDRDKINFQANV